MDKKVKLLIITQSIDENNPVLGFFCRWVEEVAKNCEKVTVICLEEGKHEFYSAKNNKENAAPRRENSKEFSGTGVKILSLGKNSRINSGVNSRVKYVINFYKYIWQERKNYDAVFVHMNPEYAVLGGIFWKLLNKKISLWYTHKRVNLKLRIAEKLVDQIFTASKESFTLKSKKVKVMGHGINIGKFKDGEFKIEREGSKINILHVGRITPIKNIKALVQAAKILKDELEKNIQVKFVGAPATEDDKEYFKEVKDLTNQLGLEREIKFLGSIPNKEITKHYQEADISVNLAPTGGMDKTVLESMASGTLVFASNLTFRDLFEQYADDLLFREKDSQDLTKKIIKTLNNDKKEEIENYLQNRVSETSSLKILTRKIIASFN